MLKIILPCLLFNPWVGATDYLSPEQLTFERQLRPANESKTDLDSKASNMWIWGEEDTSSNDYLTVVKNKLKSISSSGLDIEDLIDSVFEAGLLSDAECWMPQGISTDQEGQYLFVSWHNDPQGREYLRCGEVKGVRLSIIDLATKHYTHVLLLDENGEPLTKIKNGKPHALHAGGVAFRQYTLDNIVHKELHVAQTNKVDVFEMQHIQALNMHGYENILKRAYFYNLTTDKYLTAQANNKQTIKLASFLSYNPSSKTFLAGTFNENKGLDKIDLAENTLVRYQVPERVFFPTELLVSSIEPVGGYITEMQGAAEHYGIIWLSAGYNYNAGRLAVANHEIPIASEITDELTILTSEQTPQFGTLFTPPGIEDLTIGSDGNLWSVTEFTTLQAFIVCTTLNPSKFYNCFTNDERLLFSFDTNGFSPETYVGTRLDVTSAANDNGDVVAVWRQYSPYTNNYEHRATAFNTINGQQYFTNKLIYDYAQQGAEINPASVAIEQQGRFVVTWQDDHDENGFYEIKAKGFDINGNEILPLFTVNEVAEGQQVNPDIAMNSASGNFVIVWQDDRDNNGFYNIRLRTFDINGQGTIGSTLVNSDLNGQQRRPQVDMNGSSIVVTWEDDKDNNDYYNIYGRVANYNDIDLTWSDQFKVNSDAAGHQYWPDVSMNAGGDIAFVWQDDKDENGYYNILARTYENVNDALKPDAEFTANTTKKGQQYTPKVSLNNTDKLVVTWSDDKDKNGEYEVLASVSNLEGVKTGSDITINNISKGNQLRPDVVFSNTNTDAFYVFWQDDPEVFGIRTIGLKEVDNSQRNIMVKGFSVVDQAVSLIMNDLKLH
ncbi:hypothetical protein [Paraglaciecola sp.]|uniref:hypothetical protein n=1 Tax=Paraglaciecola sp. TaxID=1920173 RepID=UPI0030F473B5